MALLAARPGIDEKLLGLYEALASGQVALIVVDVQNDFCPGGALAVPDGDKIIPVIKRLVLSNVFRVIAVSKDWHPANHSSFNEQGGPWPPHCVQGTDGAKLHRGLKILPVSGDVIYVKKGMDVETDAYSAFNGQPNLTDELISCEVSQVLVCGLATDYCVMATARDAFIYFETYVVTDAIRAVNVKPGDGDKALEKMRNMGITMVTSDDIFAHIDSPPDYTMSDKNKI